MLASSLTQSKELWYVMRASGLVSLVLLTLTMVAGVVHVRRYSTPRWPRAVIGLLHRNVSLLAVAFLGVHIGTAALDTDVPVGWWAVLVPWTSHWNRSWVAAGTVSVDIMLALVITSLLRTHLTRRVWRLVHWLAYVSWPLAMLHGFESGTDDGTWWARSVYVISLVAVGGAVAYRLRRRAPAASARVGGRLDPSDPCRVSRSSWAPGAPLGVPVTSGGSS